MALRFVKAIRCGGDMFARCISVGFHGNQQHFAREPPCQMVSLILGVEYRWVSPSCVVTSATSTKKKIYIYIFFLGGFFLSSLPILHDKLSKEAGTRINGYDRDSGLACGRIFLPSFFCVCVCVCVVISSFLLHFLIFFPLLWPSRLSCHRKQQTKIAPVNLYIWQSTTRNPTPPPGRTLL